MGILAGAVPYDPPTAVTKTTTAALPLTALDTTNLRRTFTVPANGSVMVCLRGTLHGGTAVPQTMFGVLEGTTVRGRIPPTVHAAGTIAATTLIPVEARLTIGGLTAGAQLTWDAAYGVETGVAGSALKYGGPNDLTANNAFGAFIFEIWSTS